MKKLLISAITLALATAALHAAGPPVALLAPTPPPVDDTHDVLYLGPGRPAVLRLHLRRDGEAIVSRWDTFMAKFFAYLDRNHSGGLDRTEARLVPPAAQMMQLLSGNVYNFYPNQGNARVPFETLDPDNDGKVTVEELKLYYRTSGAGPVSVQMSNANASFIRFNGGGVNAWGSPGNANEALTETMFKLLDVNKDGRLSKQELLAAEKVFMRLDSNDDELLSITELGGNPRGNNVLVFSRTPSLARMSQPSAANTLILLPRADQGPRKTDLLAVVRTLIQAKDKDKDNKLTLEESGFPKQFFSKIDRNHDGKLDVLELARWLASKPDGEFTVHLGGSNQNRAMPASLPGTKTNARAADDAMSLTMDNVCITIVPSRTSPAMANVSQLFLGQFRAMDSPRKGFLIRRQVTLQTNYYLAAIFDLADRNSDGRLTEEEVKAYLEVVGDGAGAQVILSLTSSGQGLFQMLDTNADGQLSIRELRNAWARLERFDRDKDGCISRNEFPIQFNLNVGSGIYGAFYATSTGPGMGYPGPPVTSGRGPLWFRKMDRNGDGDVSRTEWLGSKADFDRIDTDKDGLLSLEEAEAYDALIRKK